MTKTEFAEHEQQIMETIIHALQDTEAGMLLWAVTQALPVIKANDETRPLSEALTSIIASGMKYFAIKYNFKADCDKHFQEYMQMLCFVVDEKLYIKPKGPIQ